MPKNSSARVTVFNRQKLMRIPVAAVRRIVGEVLSGEKRRFRSASVSVSFLTDRAIRSLNRRYHHRDMPTDVLAFELGGADELIADIFISTATCRRQAKVYGNLPQRELMLYCIHGMLHLVGYDDHRPADTKRMRAAEAKYLKLWLS